MTKTALLAALMALSSTATAQITYTPSASDHLGFYLGTQVWQSDASGEFGETNQRLDFHLKKQHQFNSFVAVNHPYPFLPNVRIARTTLATTGQTTLTQAFSFQDKTFAAADTVEANFQLSYVDYSFSYALYDHTNAFVALGLTLRDLHGDVAIGKASDASDNTCNDPNPSPDRPCNDDLSSSIGQIKANKIKPMLNIAGSVKVPATDINVFANADILVMANDTFADYQLGFSVDLLKTNLGQWQLNLGYRVVNLEFEDLNSLATELAFQGAFVGTVARF